MAHASDNQSAPNQPDTFAGLATALVFALLLIGNFVLGTASTTMPSSERWAALTTFSLLALGYVLQGSVGLYDALGRVVRRDIRALAVLLALVPALYISYSTAVDEFTWNGLLTAVIFVALPAVAFIRSRGRRALTPLDLVAVLYIWLSFRFGLVPELQLPQQGGQVGFFYFSAIPLLLLLLAARGWPGLGFTWFLKWSDLRIALLVAGVLLAILAGLALASGAVQPTVTIPAATVLLGRAVTIYFLIALPAEILFRGIIQNGIERSADSLLRQHNHASLLRRWLQPILHRSRHISLLLTALIFGAAYLNTPPMVGSNMLLTVIAGLGLGWVYQRTGKVTASAVSYLLVLWCWSIFFTGVGGV